MKNIAIFVALSLVFIACKKEKKVDYQRLDGTIEFVNVHKGALQSSAFRMNNNEQIISITDSKQWEDFVSEINYYSLKKEVNINFKKDQLICVFDQMRPDGGYSFLITSMIGNQENIVVNTETTEMEFGFSVPSQPFHIVKISQSKQPLIFGTQLLTPLNQ